MSHSQSIATWITDHSVAVIVILLLSTVVLGAGMGQLDDDSSLDQFESDSPEAEAATYIQEHFAGTDDGGGTTLQVIARDDNALSSASLIDGLEFQQAIRDDPAISATLADEQAIFGVENLIAQAAIEYRAEESGEPAPAPTLEAQIDAIEALSDAELEAIIGQVLTVDAEGPGALALMPTAYEPGSTTAEARMTSVTQTGTASDPMGGIDETALEAQLDIRDLAEDRDFDYLVFGSGIIFDELDRSMGDSLAIVGPVALVLVVLALAVAYRDPLDIILGVLGIVAVLVWTFGFMGWAGIAFNQMMVAVPVLLIGLSIDYAIHVFMRHREQRAADNGATTSRSSMGVALAGVGIALVWVTATTAIGFLANLISPIDALGEFGIASAFGITAALAIFGGLIPAIKIHLDGALERRGLDRRRRAFGTGDGRFSAALSAGVTAARRAPAAVILVVLVLTGAGIVGATQVDTSFNQEDFLAEEPPEWTNALPGFMQPGEYGASADLEYVSERFAREDFEGQLLIRGDLTDPSTLVALDAFTTTAADSDVVYQRPSGQPELRSPLSVMQQVAATDEEFATAYSAADTDGDDIPDTDLQSLYDALLAAEPAAGEVLASTDGEVEAMQVVVGMRGTAEFAEATQTLRGFATQLETETNGALSVTATGDPVVAHVVEMDLLDTVYQTLLITLGAVLLFLTLAYFVTGNSATLGLITVTPVLIAVSWILGSMTLLGIPFNVLTGMITSLTIGLGIAYSIHISSRYTLELKRQEDLWSALQTTVTGTGGALFGSAVTTIAAFGTLALAIFPVLQQFGIVTGLTILYTFLASVFVLPVLLVLWTRVHHPEVYRASRDTVEEGQSS